jgi:hypothetical protein
MRNGAGICHPSIHPPICTALLYRLYFLITQIQLSAKSSGMRWGGGVSDQRIKRICKWELRMREVFSRDLSSIHMFSLPILSYLYFLLTQIQLVCPVIWMRSDGVCWCLCHLYKGLTILLKYSLTESLMFSLDWPCYSRVQLPGWALCLCRKAALPLEIRYAINLRRACS